MTEEAPIGPCPPLEETDADDNTLLKETDADYSADESENT